MIQDHHYILLPDHTVKVVPLMEWATWFESTFSPTGAVNNLRRVEETNINDEVRVSTVFIWLDYAFGGPPLIFETMIFGGKNDLYQVRYSTWDEAVEGHKKAVALASKS